MVRAGPLIQLGLAAGAAYVCLPSAFVGASARARQSQDVIVCHAVDIAVPNIPRPELLKEDDPRYPKYLGSTGGYMSKSTKERHAITWTSTFEEVFEMPTGGYALMNAGENLCYFRKKEQCLAVGKELRKMKIENYKIYRIAKDGTVTFMHPADGVFPEKCNKGRVQVNGRPFTAAMNPPPAELKYTRYHQRSYEADPLTTLFIRARMFAMQDIENNFPLPNPDFSDYDEIRALKEEDIPEYTKQKREELLKVCLFLPVFV